MNCYEMENPMHKGNKSLKGNEVVSLQITARGLIDMFSTIQPSWEPEVSSKLDPMSRLEPIRSCSRHPPGLMAYTSAESASF
jgi:hypothetical protein